VQKKYKGTYYSSAMTGFIIHKFDGMRHVFIPSKKWLFYSHVKGNIAHLVINTVEENKNKYTVNEYTAAFKTLLGTVKILLNM